MRVLVTGATGLVGRHLVARLRTERHDVRALVRPSSDTAALAAAGVEIVTVDLAGGDPMDAAVEGCEVVHHLAAAHGRHATPAMCEAVNVQGTERLARAAARAGVRRFVLASTRGVHGLVRSGIIDEQTPVAPDTPYRASKLRAESVVARCRDRDGLRAVTVRLPSMVGSGSRTWLPLFRAVASGRFHVIGSGANRMHPSHVEDTVEGLRLAAAAPGLDGETFIIAGTAPLSVGEFVGQIAAALGVSVARTRIPRAPYLAYLAASHLAARVRGRLAQTDSRQFWVSNYEIDDRKARARFGYAPSRSLQDAVNATVAHYRSQGAL